MGDDQLLQSKMKQHPEDVTTKVFDLKGKKKSITTTHFFIIGSASKILPQKQNV